MLKHGVKPEKHGIAYQRGSVPKLLAKEPEPGFRPIEIDMYANGERLSRESRINYSKLVTVEHNVKVMFIGAVARSDWPTVTDAVNKCWDQKTQQKFERRKKD